MERVLDAGSIPATSTNQQSKDLYLVSRADTNKIINSAYFFTQLINTCLTLVKFAYWKVFDRKSRLTRQFACAEFYGWFVLRKAYGWKKPWYSF